MVKTIKIGFSRIEFNLDSGWIHVVCACFPAETYIKDVTGTRFSPGKSIDDPVTYIIETINGNIHVKDIGGPNQDPEKVLRKIRRHLSMMQTIKSFSAY